MSFRVRALLASALCAATSLGVGGVAHGVLPRGDALARGVRIGGTLAAAGEDGATLAARRGDELAATRVALRWGGRPVLQATLGELGAQVDTGAAAREATRIGRAGDVLARLEEALSARRGEVDVPLRVRVPVEALAERLGRFKDEHDTPARDARLDVDHHTATAHAPGKYLDVYAAAEAVERAVSSAPPGGGPITIDLGTLDVPPSATREAVLAIRTDRVLARYETRFASAGKQAGRAKNVARAAAGMDGVVLMPGETVSFNDNVGPRVEDNGFTLAPEIYKGEMREGVGGGTCQVAGTVHAAAFFGGLEIVERASHSRPSGYIPMGLDATVVYPYVDLKLKNPFDFPVVLRARVGDGVLAFELLGRERPVEVELATEVLGTATFKRKVEETARVTPGSFRLKQKGIPGTTLRKLRRLRGRDGRERVETSVDVYPPTFEIYEIAPGDDPTAVLPPPPEDPKAAAEVYSG